MGILCGWASIDERGKIKGGQAGDQTGKELRTGSWYQFKQTQIMRWKDRSLAEKYAKAIRFMCDSPLIGYDQSQRTSLYNALKAVGWDYTRLSSNVECDCSELVACAVNCVLGRASVPSYSYTGNLKAHLMNTGAFTLLTGSKYTGSDQYIAIGDVINAPGKHVISALASGSKAGVTSVADGGSLTAEPTLRKGSSGSQVKKLQKNLNTLGITDACGKKLSEDGDFGACTRESVKKFQDQYGLAVDGVYGPKSYVKMKSLIG